MGRGQAAGFGAVAALLALVVLGACSAEEAEPATGHRPSSSAPSSGSMTPTPSGRGESGGPDPATPRPGRPVRAGDFDRLQARAVVRHLAGDIGPRHATSDAFHTAARWAADHLRGLGYVVRRQRVDVPAGTSWGVPVAAGSSANVVATPPGFDPTDPHVVVGAHLDTVPQAPGAEDDASGVGVLLAAADAVATARSRLPVVWVAFGAEEPRGPGDDDHHFGSRAYVAALGGSERRAVRAMVSLDRVGVGGVVPVGSATGGDPLQRQLLRAGRTAGVATSPEPGQRSSDHWSFVRAGMPGVRLGSTPYAGYHSPADVPAVVDPAQLERTGRLLLAWLSPDG